MFDVCADNLGQFEMLLLYRNGAEIKSFYTQRQFSALEVTVISSLSWCVGVTFGCMLPHHEQPCWCCCRSLWEWAVDYTRCPKAIQSSPGYPCDRQHRLASSIAVVPSRPPGCPSTKCGSSTPTRSSQGGPCRCSWRQVVLSLGMGEGAVSLPFWGYPVLSVHIYAQFYLFFFPQ